MRLSDLELGEEIVDPLEQQREEWFAKRSGRITCSNFGKLIGSGRGKDDAFTQTGMSYLRMKVAERLGSWHSVSAKSMQWGTDNEAAAIAAYAERTGFVVDSRPFQFFELGDDLGGTPDGLIGADGTLEGKCPYDPSVHVNTLITRLIPKDYVWQVHGHLFVTGRQWCDFVSFDPRISDDRRLVIIRQERDQAKLEFLASRLALAVDEVNRLFELTKGDV